MQGQLQRALKATGSSPGRGRNVVGQRWSTGAALLCGLDLSLAAERLLGHQPSRARPKGTLPSAAQGPSTLK